MSLLPANRTGTHAARSARGPDALWPAHFRIDDRSLAERIARFRAIAELFPATGPSDASSASWAALLEKDPAFLLADAAIYDASARYRAQRPGGAAGSIAPEGRAVIDRWATRAASAASVLGASATSLEFRALIAAVLSDEFEGLALGPAGFEARALRQIGADGGDAPALEGRALDSAMMRAAGRISDGARTLLEQAIDGGGGHPADAGLALAFLRLMGHVQAALNSFTERHLDHYYNGVLGHAPRGGGTDSALVSVDPGPGSEALILPEGTALDAGRDSAGRPALFRTVGTLRATRGRLAHMSTLFLQTRQRRADGTGGAPRSAVERILVRSETAPIGASTARPTAKGGWPLFGAPGEGVSARLGLEIAAPALALEGGERSVALCLKTLPGPDGSLAEAVDRFAALRPSVPLSRAFCLAATGPSAMVSIPEFTVTADGDDLIVGFTLSPEAPAIAAPDAPAGALPALSLEFREDQRRHAAVAFVGLRVDRVEIRAEVAGLETVHLSNQNGDLSPAQPFPPFGAAPPRGALFTLSHPEFAKLGIDRAAVTLHWANLPSPPASLADRYADWGLGLGDDSFRVDMEFDDPAGWRPLGQGATETRALRLFAPAVPAGLAPVSRFDGALPGGAGPLRALRLRLTAPEGGFGQEAYPALLATAAAAQARAAARRSPFRRAPPPALPKPPFTPLALRATVDYRVRSAVGPDEATGRLTALGPFGRRAKGAGPLGLADLPRGDDGLFGATLFLGLDGVSPGDEISLLFDLDDAPGESRLAGGDAAPEAGTAWRYLDSEEWRDLPAARVLGDTTAGFRTAGILRVRLPAGLAPGAAGMPRAEAWLSVSLPPGRADRLGAARAVLLNAVAATRRREAGDGAPTGPVSAVVAGHLASSIRGLHQPRKARPARAAEGTRDFRIRVSEHLSHKGRAVLPRDYERIVLEAFPEIGECLCLSRPARGVDLVVAPRRRAGDADLGLPDVLLAAIAEHVAPLMPLGAGRLRVRTVTPETVRVTAIVRTAPGSEPTSTASIDAAIAGAVAPWLADPEIPLPLGAGRIAPARVAHAVEALPGVRRVLNIHLVRFYATEAGASGPRAEAARGRKVHRLEDSARWSGDTAFIEPSTPWSVLVPASRHRLDLVDPDEEVRLLAPIGHASVGKDAVGPTGWSRWARTRDPIYFVHPDLAGIGTLAVGTELTLTNPHSGVLSPVRTLPGSA